MRLLLNWSIILGLLISTQIGYANDAISDKDMVVFRAISNSKITFELEGSSKLDLKSDGVVSVSFDLKTKGVTEDKGAVLYYYDIIGQPEFELVSIADMSKLSLAERKKAFGLSAEYFIFVKGVKKEDELFAGVELVSGSLSGATAHPKDILFPPDEIKDDITHLFKKLDNDFKAEVSGVDDFFYGGVSFYTSEEEFMSDEEASVALVRNEYASLTYSLKTEEMAQVLITLINYTHSYFSLENIKENPEHLVFVVKKNGNPIGFCELEKYESDYNFRLTELIESSKLKASIEELWTTLDSNPSALQGKFKSNEDGTPIHESTSRLFAAKESNYMEDNGAHFVNSLYNFYSAEALIYLVKRLDIQVPGRKKDLDTANNNAQYYAEIHTKGNSYYGLIIGESDGKVILNLNVDK